MSSWVYLYCSCALEASRCSRVQRVIHKTKQDEAVSDFCCIHITVETNDYNNNSSNIIFAHLYCFLRNWAYDNDSNLETPSNTSYLAVFNKQLNTLTPLQQRRGSAPVFVSTAFAWLHGWLNWFEFMPKITTYLKLIKYKYSLFLTKNSHYWKHKLYITHRQQAVLLKTEKPRYEMQHVNNYPLNFTTL